MDRDLAALLDRLAARFPEAHPVRLRPPADAAVWGRHAERFSGHARRWFSVTDGQDGRRPAIDGYRFESLADALQVVEVSDELRAEPEGYWVEPSWLPIAGDGAGQHFMIDDDDGRVLAVAHDDDAVAVLADSPEAWLEDLLAAHASGALVFHPTFGLTSAEELAAMERRRAERRARQEPGPLPLKHKIGLALTLLSTAVLSALVIWWLESTR
jgi:hypothetical protein